jgi:hypothetical protein
MSDFLPLSCRHTHGCDGHHSHSASTAQTHQHETKAERPATTSDHISCSHAHGKSKSAHDNTKPLIDVLSDHPAIRILQAGTGLLMIPMVPMMAYSLYSTVHSGFKSGAAMPT